MPSVIYYNIDWFCHSSDEWRICCITPSSISLFSEGIKNCSPGFPSFVLSCSVDRTCILWEYKNRSLILRRILNCQASVSYACGIQCAKEDKPLVLATCSTDCTLKIWRISKDCKRIQFCTAQIFRHEVLF